MTWPKFLKTLGRGMTKNKDFSVTGSLAGKCLISMRGMTDPRFEKSVIYICSHAPEEGAMGFVINKPAAHVAYSEILLQLGLPLGDKENYPVVLSGGPMENIRGFVLHSNDYRQSDSTPVDEDISLTATMDILADIAAGPGPKHALFLLGYSGWRDGQLEAEIAGNCWLVVPANDFLMFECPFSRRWTQALALLGVNPSMLSIEQGSV